MLSYVVGDVSPVGTAEQKRKAVVVRNIYAISMQYLCKSKKTVDIPPVLYYNTKL